MPDKLDVNSAQRSYARLAGFAFLIVDAADLFGLLTLSRIKGSGDFAETTRRVLASEHLYRIALSSMAIAWASTVILAYALYVALEPVNKRLAQLALLFRLTESAIGSVLVLLGFATLGLYTTAHASGPIQNDQLQALVSLARNLNNSGFYLAVMFFGPGSALFFYLFYKSYYIPRPLAALGVFGSVAVAIVSFAMLILPEHAATIQYGWAPIALAETATAFLLIIRGIRPPPGNVAPT